jgi:hypothetical protein
VWGLSIYNGMLKKALLADVFTPFDRCPSFQVVLKSESKSGLIRSLLVKVLAILDVFSL